MTPTQAAVIQWHQLWLGLRSSATIASSGDAAKVTAGRVNALRELFFALTADMAVTNLLEIGAMHAECSRRFVKTPGHRAIAYEAAARNYNKALADPLPNGLDLINCAIGGKRGEVSFFLPIDERAEQWGSLRKRLERAVPVEEFKVPMITLDEAAVHFVRTQSIRDLALWIDVEGAALEVLASGPKSLQNHVGVIYVELNDRNVYEDGGTSLQVLELMLKSGFIPVARDNQFPGAWNLLLVHETGYPSVHGRIATWMQRHA
jgi:FkbM family methyltransferase